MKRIQTLISSVARAVDLTDVLFFGGIALVGYGLSTIIPGAGYVAVGLLLVLSVRPLIRWVK